MSIHSIPFQEFGAAGPELLFLHANGYPPACYRPLFDRLAEKTRVTAMLQRPLWEGSQPEHIRDWIPISADVLRFLEENEARAPEAVIGHSLGGIAALRAAIRQPQKFRKLVLLDPVLLPPYYVAVWSLALAFRFAQHLLPHIKAAERRRREFDDLELLFKSYRRRAIFKYMDDEGLRAYVEGIVRPKVNGGYELAYSPEWESRIYYTGIWRDLEIWRALKNLKVPTLIIRGAETDTFLEQTARKVTRLNPSIRVESVERATHLVPLEQPRRVSEIILNFLEKHT